VAGTGTETVELGTSVELALAKPTGGQTQSNTKNRQRIFQDLVLMANFTMS
jgi:hypothetical protein